MFQKKNLLWALCLTVTVTACSKPPQQMVKFQNRPQFHAYLDNMDMPDHFRDAIKSGTEKVSGKFINNVVTYLELKGDPIKELVKRYGMKASVSSDGLDIEPAVKAAVADLIQAGDKANRGYGGKNNSGWLQHEDLMGGGEWSEGAGYFQQAGQLRDQKRAPASQIDTGN
ncbi:MAG: hypothetical protein HY816_18615 [Candidatus Wallbacteria bacterium]|nr:hypothetical protein [Candidatus Wallbacteria bacterium]